LLIQTLTATRSLLRSIPSLPTSSAGRVGTWGYLVDTPTDFSDEGTFQS
jgi:hypothetical protein